MVVLAVTWMAKVGREAEVAALFEKLTEQSRKEPGCAMYQVHRHKTEPRRYFIYEQYKDDAALEAHRAAPHLSPATALLLVDHQLAAGSVALLRDFVKRNDDSFAARPGLFDESIGDPLRDLALLIGGTALQHCDLNHGHKGSSQMSVLSSQ
jgi:quinol monooxygenase YgiN